MLTVNHLNRQITLHLQHGQLHLFYPRLPNFSQRRHMPNAWFWHAHACVLHVRTHWIVKWWRTEKPT